MSKQTDMGLKERRKAFYEKIAGFWPDLYGKEYALFDLFRMKEEEVREIRAASRSMGRIFWKMGELLRRAPDETLLGMGYPKALLPYLRIKTLTSETVIARLDLTYARGAYRCIELNADTPTFIMETHRVNGLVCHEFSAQDPNEGEEVVLSEGVNRAIEEAIARFLNQLQDLPGEKGRTDQPLIVFTSHEENSEDRETTRYLQSLTRFPSTYIPLHQLEILRGEGLFSPDGRRIDLLYRQTYPLEQLIEDRGASGEPIGLWLMELVRMGRLTILNPPSAFLLQNKAVQAAIWALHEEGNPYFSEEEHALIERHFLPTYLDPEPFRLADKPFVEKPIFGREGDTVKIYNGNGRLDVKDPHETYATYPSVYQEYAPLPMVTWMTSEGRGKGYLLIGSFLIHGEPGAIGLRAGGPITDNLSYFMPAGIGGDR